MIKEFLMKKMLDAKLKGLPEDQKNKIVELFTKNPELFAKIAEEVKEKVKTGKTEQEASIEVMMKYKSELQKAAGN